MDTFRKWWNKPKVKMKNRTAFLNKCGKWYRQTTTTKKTSQEKMKSAKINE